MGLAAAFRRCLEDMDVAGARRIWSHGFAHLPQPSTDEQAEIVMHMARTSAESMLLKARAWSHRWLLDRGYPSQLPDELKPKAERIYPRVVEGVLISVNFRNPEMKPAADFIRGAMETAVLEAYDAKVVDQVFVRTRMKEARQGAMRQAFGRFYRPAVEA